MTKEFQKNVEDFTCDKCSALIVGNGYTNHCPECLHSKHVDVFPGDRASDCGGLMEPIEVTQEKDSYVLTHTCTTCAYTKKNKLATNDNMETVVNLAKKLATQT